MEHVVLNNGFGDLEMQNDNPLGIVKSKIAEI